VSDDLLLLSIEQNAQALAPLRSTPPLYAAMASCEDVGGDPFDSVPEGLAEYVRASCGQVEVVHELPCCVGAHGPAYGLTVFVDGTIPEDQGVAAFRAFRPVAHRLSVLIRELPERTLSRLGFRSVFGTPLDDWAWVLFHLAWHFPDHFARGVVHRDRLLRVEGGMFVAQEDWIQLGGVTGTPPDCHPGLIFSRFPRELDLVTATGYAVDLLRQAVRGGAAFQITEAIREQLIRLHQEFTAFGTLAATHRGGPLGSDLAPRVLRLDNSFRTPAAAQWAGYRAGGTIQENLFLARSGDTKEVCVLRGPSVNDFTRRANQAGALLPAWPEQPAAALLEDAPAWLGRVARMRELQSQQFEIVTPDGSPPHGEPIPRSQLAQYYWESTRMLPGWGRMVTDHRGNVERWVGYVFHVFKEFEPELVEIRTFPVGQHGDGHGWNAILTLPGMNFYQASARAMELAGWVRPAAGARGQQPTSGLQADESTARAVCFDDPWKGAPYPPPGIGRYVRFHRGDRSGSGEPEWQPGWAWTERPEDGWIECGECGSGAGRVLVARGRPPEVCDWLPPDWPAGFFPLGGTAEHCVGWRSLVLRVLTHDQDTIPPDDREYGWLTLTRATRHLAHHLGVVPLDRVIAPLPASRGEARREVEPLLDGLVFARGRASASPTPVPPSPVGDVAPAPPFPTEVAQPGRPATITALGSEIDQLLAEARAAYSNSERGFTLVALPCRDDVNGARAQGCEEGSPDVGQIRDGVFYWPLRSFRHFGSVTAGELGSFVFMAFARAGDSFRAFHEFSGRAGAVLLAAAPPWAGIGRPGPAYTTWASAVMFLSPSARSHVVEQPTGPRILSNPWAASIAALRDILVPPTPVSERSDAVASPPPSSAVPTWDGTARRLLFRGQVCKQFARPAPNQERILATFQEEGWPDAVDDPLPAGKLAQTVESLNDRLQHIKFRLNGAGTGVCWYTG
jgi:hypothetical protein